MKWEYHCTIPQDLKTAKRTKLDAYLEERGKPISPDARIKFEQCHKSPGRFKLLVAPPPDLCPIHDSLEPCSICKAELRQAQAACRPSNKESFGDLERVVSTPITELRFGDFAELRVGGRDKYSAMRRPELVSHLSDEAVQKVDKHFGAEGDRLTALRWMCRGLDAEKAIRKVETDKEISANARSAKAHRGLRRR